MLLDLNFAYERIGYIPPNSLTKCNTPFRANSSFFIVQIRYRFEIEFICDRTPRDWNKSLWSIPLFHSDSQTQSYCRDRSPLA